MGNRQNKFNVRRNSYNDENSFTNAMKTKIPSFNSKYANKLEIKEDKLNYIGDNEQEREWLAEVISVAGILKINYVYENGTQAATPYQQVIPDGSYEVESPKIDGYEPDHYIVCGEIEGDTNITVTYYGESQGLAYELLADGTYTVAGIGSFAGENLVIPEKYNDIDITQIKKEAFKGNKNIKKIVILNNIKKVGYDAFDGAKNLEYIRLDSEITDPWAFGTSSVKEIELGENIKQIEAYSFSKCTTLERISIYTEQADITTICFSGDILLNKIIINPNNSKYKFSNKILYSTDMKKIYMYLPSNQETSLNLDRIEETASYSFLGNKHLTSIKISESIKKIGNDTFNSCSNLESIDINCERLEAWAFCNCSKLKKVEIDTNIKYIGDRCFSADNSIEEMKYKGTIEQWNNIVKSSSWNSNSNITQVICLDGIVNL